MRPLKRSTRPFGPGMLRWGKAVFDAKVAAQLVEVVLAGGGPFALTEQAVGEFAAIVG